MSRSLSVRTLLGVPLAAVALLLALASGSTFAQEAPPEPGEAILDEVREDAAARGLAEDPEDVDVLRVEAVTWSEACLGAPEPDEFCAEVLTDGFAIWVETGPEMMRYHTSESADTVRFAARGLDPAAVDEAPLPPDATVRGDPPPAEPVTYTVQPGDTLFSIAVEFGTSVGLIADANDIVNPDVISVGQELVIPEPMPTPPAEPAPPADTYTVQPGDTLFSIAEQFGTSVSAFVEANDLADANVIFAGQVLVVPEAAEPPAEPSPPAEPAPPEYISYTVQPGDTLNSIAREFGTTVEEIVQANHPGAIGDPNVIQPGQVFVIPG